MTVEEIKNQLEELIKDRESFMIEDYDKDIYDRDKEALEFAIKAVEKQIPKKINREYVSKNGISLGYSARQCPNCKADFYYADLGQTMFCDFCPDCGQSLEWGNNDEKS